MAFLFLPAAVLVVFSRVYLGTHYVSDILGGMLTALLAAAVVRATYRQGTPLDRLVTSIL
jgi:undecaprenyl-diphosphatase